MIQLFFSNSKINANEWEIAYSKIVQIVEGFPFKLLRLESYNGFSSELDSLHCDLYVNKDTEDEYISFYIDGLTFKGGDTVCFYKKWEKQVSKGLYDNEVINNEKPLYWFPVDEHAFSGNPIKANGVSLFSSSFDSGAIYRYVVLAIGIFLENYFIGRVLLIVNDFDNTKIFETKKWTEWLLHENLSMPMYLDKNGMLDLLKDHYDRPEDLVGRIENLYPHSLVTSMAYCIENVGYNASLCYYAKLLSTTRFKTFGFSDILQPWIAVTKDLEKCLQLIAKSKEILLSNANERSIAEAEEYDLKEILKDLLSNYILWTPEQREKLDFFYTNKKALETGKEDLFGTIMRIEGNRVDICPIYTTQNTLFETFMYYNPKEGKEYQNIITDWVEKNKNKYESISQKLASIENDLLVQLEQQEEKENIEKVVPLKSEVDTMIEMIPQEAYFFVDEAIAQHPFIVNIDHCISDFVNGLIALFKKDNRIESVISFYKSSKEDKMNKIRYIIKEKRMSYTTGVHFMNLIAQEDEKTMTDLFFVLATKVYDDRFYIARQHLIYDNSKWDYLKTFGFCNNVIGTSTI